MNVVILVRVHQDDDLSIENSESHQSHFAVRLALVLAGNGEVVPNGLSSYEVEAMVLDIASTLGLAPSRHELIVVTIYVWCNYFRDPSLSEV